jgi:AcrR family transcriptional regulator
MPKVTARHKEKRRQAILEAAEAVFLGKGYQLATVDDIAARSGLSVGALYRYFSTKSDIMLTLLDERMGRTPDLLRRLTGHTDDAWEALVRCVDIFVSALRVRHPSTGRLLLVAWGEALQDHTVRAGLLRRFAGLAEYLESVVTKGVEAGVFRRDADASALAALLVCMADGATLYWSANTADLDLSRLRSTVLAALSAYLRVAPSTREE